MSGVDIEGLQQRHGNRQHKIGREASLGQAADPLQEVSAIAKLGYDAKLLVGHVIRDY